MRTEVLVHAPDLAAAEEEVTAAGGRLVHVLTPHLLVVTLPDEVSVDSLQTISSQRPDAMERLEHVLADAWTSRFGVESQALGRLDESAAAPAISWETAGFVPPDHLPDERGPVSFDAEAMEGFDLESTGTPTSLVLTGSIAVGIVMVSGPPWTQVPGALKYVSVGADGTVWGVNASDKIYRRSGTQWQQVAGALKQISVGNAANVWGVNASDKIYRWNGSGWTQVSGALKHVSVGADDTVWGESASGNIYRRDGNRWQQVAGALKQVSTGTTNLVWGVNRSDSIYRRAVLATP
jgi:hypothetical protein